MDHTAYVGIVFKYVKNFIKVGPNNKYPSKKKSGTVTKFYNSWHLQVFCTKCNRGTGKPPVPKPKTIFGYQKLLLLPLLGDHRDISALYSKIYLWCTHTYVGLVLNLPKIRTCIYIYMYWRGRNFVMYEYFVLNFQREMNASWKIFSFINFSNFHM